MKEMQQAYYRHGATNLIENGGFENGLKLWALDENFRKGVRGWKKVVSSTLDLHRVEGMEGSHCAWIFPVHTM